LATEEPWTIQRLLTWTSGYLKDRGSESPRLDAEVLLAHVLDYSRVDLYTHWQEEVPPTPRSAYRSLIRQRAEGAPVAYLVGRKEFFSLSLEVKPEVLIPRPDSEFVVVAGLEALKGVTEPSVVDVGTGSGNLVLAIASQRPDARLWATDLSPEALTVARKNAERLGLAERVGFVRGDLLEPVLEHRPFDLIVSNPPYIPTAIIQRLEPGVRDYEPHLALDGGPDGLRVVARLIEQAIDALKPGARLVLEIGSDQEEPVRGLIEQAGAFHLDPTMTDGAGHPRVLTAARASGS